MLSQTADHLFWMARYTERAENTARMLTLEAPARRRLPFAQRIMLKMKGVVASQARKQVAKRAKREHYPVPYAILEIWQKYGGNALAVPAQDPASIERLITHPTGKNLVRIFFLQERLKGLGKGEFKPRHVHVVGAGDDVVGASRLHGDDVRGLETEGQANDSAPHKAMPCIA